MCLGDYISQNALSTKDYNFQNSPCQQHPCAYHTVAWATTKATVVLPRAPVWSHSLLALQQ